MTNSDQDISLVKAENIEKTYGKKAVVRGVSYELRQGEVVGLLGPNGAGKTTSFYMIVGVVKPSRGKVLFDGKDITGYAMYKRARMGISYLPQEPSIFRKMTVENNIMAILQLQSYTRTQRKEKLEQLLEDFRITHIRKSMGYMLSGGERRRCEIARALASNPKFILLDEPFAGIDPITVEEIMHLVLGLKQRGLGILITDHNVHETLSITDRAYILIDGNVFASGTAKELAENVEVRNRYLGETFSLERYE
ncbi:MAG TPA: LPS export ABC transporter ATP-binding protein [Candidatus Kapabacteria bacterium]|jgi:lipopolysaccharide export system ATP-binding protein|nr:LPS export ABC transporter ATP-binding protein [Ignavibacteria bacterium]HRE58882.1 LPS export ABC transporter ATP-binding protein [Candidatus Kapabacteria bacterium]